MKLFRTILFWCHLVSGVVAGLIILLMSATGVLLTYEKQMIAAANARAYSIAPSSSDTPRFPMSALVSRVAQQQGELPSNVTVRAEPNSPVEMNYGREKTFFMHPYSGQVLGEGAQNLRGFFGAVTSWHRWIGREGEGRDAGKAITGACNLAFGFLVLSGLYLWWPRNKSRAGWRNILWFRRGLPSKARDFNWHNVIGFWSLVPLFLIVLSGVVISYPWASALVFRSVGEEPPARRGPPGGREGGRAGGAREGTRSEGVSGPTAVDTSVLAGMNQAWQRAESQVAGWKSISLAVPKEKDAPLEFSIDSGSGGQPQLKAQLVLRRDGQIEKLESFGDQSPGRRLRSFLRFAHTGEFGGIAGQTVAGIASLGGVFLVWTGLALSWRRLLAARARKARGQAPPLAEAAE